MNSFKRFGDYITAAFKLGRTERRANIAYRYTQESQRLLNDLSRKIDNLEGQDAMRSRRLKDNIQHMVHGETLGLMARNAELARNYVELSRRLDQILLAVNDGKFQQANPEQLPKDNDGLGAVMDSFYHRLGNKYRGTTHEIRSHLRTYLPDVESAVLRTGDKPVMDIGCGRGEWLRLLQDTGITAVGIDTNLSQISEVQSQGLDARQDDARSALSKVEDNSLACITAHHLIEHLPFEEVVWITREALRVLAPGGLLLFETPNVRNVLVGATYFYNDPTRLRAITDPVLNVLFETVGLHPIETRHLQPHEKLTEFMAKPGFDPELANLMFGAQKFAILGYKPLQEV